MQQGHAVVLDDEMLVNAFSSGSALGTLYALENTVPLFAAAPLTPVTRPARSTSQARAAATQPVDQAGEQCRALLGRRAGRVAEDAGRAHRPHALGPQPRQQRRRSASSPPATARSPSTPSGSTCNISDVSVRPAWASPPGTPHGNQATSRPSDRSSGTADRSASRLPPCPLTISTRPAQRQAERPYSTSRPVSASVPIEIVPGKPSCSPLAP